MAIISPIRIGTKRYLAVHLPDASFCIVIDRRKDEEIMKVAVFNTVRGGVARFAPSAARYEEEIELIAYDCPATVENLDMAKGCEAMVYTPVAKQPEYFWERLSQLGIKYIVTPSAGYDHYDLVAMKKYGLKGSNVPQYSPNAIAEHAVLLTLSALRHFREQIHRIDKNDYTITGVRGKEIRKQTIGIVGAGRIGGTTIKIMHGFGAKVLAYDRHPKEELMPYCDFVSLEELYKQCDVLIYHCAYSADNHHMVNAETIPMMKDGVTVINVARGGLFDIDAVYEAVKSGKIGALGIDVIEDEDIIKENLKPDRCPLPTLEKLLTMENVVFTMHTAFYTDEAEKNMADTMIDSLHSYITTGESKLELVK